MKAIVKGPGRPITRAASALSIPMSSMTMAITGRPPVAGMAKAYRCQAGFPTDGGAEGAAGGARAAPAGGEGTAAGLGATTPPERVRWDFRFASLAELVEAHRAELRG